MATTGDGADRKRKSAKSKYRVNIDLSKEAYEKVQAEADREKRSVRKQLEFVIENMYAPKRGLVGIPQSQTA